MTSSSPSQNSDHSGRTDTCGGRHYVNNPGLLKEELRQSIIAKRHARGETQLRVEHTEPQDMPLTPAEVEKKERRREQNRRAAQRCRHKKRLNQKHVIQNYEEVVARNEELQKELDAVKRELNKIRNTRGHHLMCCPSYDKVKPESSQAIKREPMSVDELQNVNTNVSLCNIEYPGKKANAADIARCVPNTPNTNAHLSGSDKFGTSAGLLERGISTSSTRQQPQVDLVPRETDFLQSPQSNSENTNQGLPWGYTCDLDENNSPTSHMHSGLNQELAAFLLSAQLQVNGHKSLRHQKQENELQPQQPSHLENAENMCSVQRGEVQTATIPSTHYVSTQRYTFVDDSGHVLSQNSPCHVVPSLRSPRPDSVTSTISGTYDNIRHRSLSGGSGCTSDAPRRCCTEGEFSSVSSEGSWSALSMYQDLRTLEVSDTDTDDVFMNPPTGTGIPLDGHDDNNNLETFPNNNIVMETGLFQLLQTRPSEMDWLSSTPLSRNSTREAAPRASDPSSGIIDSDDISSLIQLSSDDLQIFNDIDNDIMSTLLSTAQRIDY